MKVFTIGTDHRTHFDFARLLVKYGIEVLFDVRRAPESREDHFRRDGLQALAAGQGIDYIFMGNELGGPCYDGRGQWTDSDEFKRGIDIIRSKASKRACCVLCAERTPENCHRLSIAEHLAKQGIEVVHILDENSVWSPPPRRPSPPAPRPDLRSSHPDRGRWRRPGPRR
jgi:uncharacterized protein (DUF488 family)